VSATCLAAPLIDQGQAQEGVVILEILEDGVPPRFRLHSETEDPPAAHLSVIETMRPQGILQQFSMTERRGQFGISRGNPGASFVSSEACASEGSFDLPTDSSPALSTLAKVLLLFE
jgi:hypothetical protein